MCGSYVLPERLECPRCRWQAASSGGPFFLWRESSFLLAARPLLERYSAFCGAGHVRNHPSGFSRLPKGDFAFRVEPRTAIVIFGGNRRSAAVRTLYVAAEARCRGRNKLGERSLDAGGARGGFRPYGRGKSALPRPSVPQRPSRHPPFRKSIAVVIL